MNSLSLVTYTNSVMKDAWPVYFGQLDEYFDIENSFVFSDIDCEDYPGHKFIKYNNDDPYYIQYTSCLESVSDDFVIYAQEDFFLYDKVKIEKLEKYIEFLKNTDYSFVRLIKCGYKYDQDSYEDVHVKDDMYKVDTDSRDAFSMQPTIWKKEKLAELYLHVKSQKWLESDSWNKGCLDRNINGVLTYNGESKKGRYHYDSSIYPYTATGITKGRWNMYRYESFLSEMFEKYDVDPNERGLRLSQFQYTK